MKYMLLIYYEEQALSDTEREACYVDSTQLAHLLRKKIVQAVDLAIPRSTDT